MSYYEELLTDWKDAADGYELIADAVADVNPEVAREAKAMAFAIRWCRGQLQEVIDLETDG